MKSIYVSNATKVHAPEIIPADYIIAIITDPIQPSTGDIIIIPIRPATTKVT